MHGAHANVYKDSAANVICLHFEIIKLSKLFYENCKFQIGKANQSRSE